MYTMIDERGLPRRREFFIKVTVGTQSAVGSGPNKKVAKRAAAEVNNKIYIKLYLSHFYRSNCRFATATLKKSF